MFWLLHHGFSPDEQRSTVPTDISENLFTLPAKMKYSGNAFFLNQSTHRVHAFFKESLPPCTHNQCSLYLSGAAKSIIGTLKWSSAQLMTHNVGGVALCFCLFYTFAFWSEKSIKMTSKTHHRHSEEVFPSL